ncbi:MAG: aldehyde ferredoxin oxidoreductase N-terminal domain-containing protein [Promethearchaeota archaeon]
MEWKGYTGKILNVNLSENKISILEENFNDIKKYIGGFGMNCKLGADIIRNGIDPLSRENIIIIGTGPLVGTITPGASRTVGFSKFPASKAIANSCGSMSFGFHLKQAGFDHIIITGKSEYPIYLEILDQNIDVCRAKNLWGDDIVKTTNYLWKKYNSCGVIAIGQAGENLVKSSLALIDKTSTFGRGGLGAVMGSKNLKAIIVKGTLGLSIAYPRDFIKLYNILIERIRKYPQRKSWIDLGMLRSLPIGLLLSAKGQKRKARQCSDRFYIKKLKERRISCPACPMADKDILKIKEGTFSELINYTSSVINPFLMLTLDALNNSNQAIKIFDLINRYGLDSLTITALFEFLLKLHEKGIITENNTGIIWNNDFKTLNKLIETITFRKGFGNVLADGWEKLAELFPEVREKMLIVKGLDVIFEPRLLRLGTMEFEQTVNPKGSHVASGGSPTYVGAASNINKFKTHFNRMGIPDSAIERIFKPPNKKMLLNVGRLTRYSEDWYAILTNVGICARAQMNRFWSLELVTDFFNAVTGFNLQKEDLRLAAERSWNLLKILNVCEGFSRKDDNFPKEWFKPLKYGNNEFKFYDFFGETIITPSISNQLLDDYYDERGWSKINGIPNEKKIKELSLDRYFSKINKIES